MSNVMIDSSDCAHNWVGRLYGRDLDTTIPTQSQLFRLLLQMKSKAQDGSVHFWDILAPLLYIWRKQRYVRHLYVVPGLQSITSMCVTIMSFKGAQKSKIC